MTIADEQYDILIVGSGAGSVVAALTAKDMGASSLIIEKQDVFGGSTAYSGGVAWVPNSPLRCVDDNVGAARQYLEAVLEYAGDSGKASSPEKREMFLREGNTALARGYGVATMSQREFERVAGLRVVPVSPFLARAAVR